MLRWPRIAIAGCAAMLIVLALAACEGGGESGEVPETVVRTVVETVEVEGPSATGGTTVSGGGTFAPNVLQGEVGEEIEIANGMVWEIVNASWLPPQENTGYVGAPVEGPFVLLEVRLVNNTDQYLDVTPDQLELYTDLTTHFSYWDETGLLYTYDEEFTGTVAPRAETSGLVAFELENEDETPRFVQIYDSGYAEVSPTVLAIVNLEGSVERLPG